MQNSYRSLSIPNPTPLLFFLAGLIVWLVFLHEDPDSIGLMILLGLAAVIVVPICIYNLTMKPLVATFVLFSAVVMPRFFVEIGGMKARPEHIICGILIFSLPYWFRQQKHQLVWLFADYLVLIYISLHFFSSTVMSIAPGQTLKWFLLQAIVVLPYLFVRFLVSDQISFERAVRILAWIGAAEGVFGILCFYSNLFFGTEVGMEIGQYGDIPGTYGTQFEANLLGSYCGAAAVIFMTMYLRQRKRAFLYGFGLAAGGMAISLSRGALLSTVIALSVVCFRGIKLRLFNKKVLVSIALVILVVMVMAAPAIFGLWSQRFSTIDLGDISADGDTQIRVLSIGLALGEASNHLLLGNGTDSYQLQFDATDLGFGDAMPGWVSNTEVRVLYDTGLIGLGVFLWFLGWLAVRVIRHLKKERAVELEALTIACVVYCVSFQFTEGTLLAFSWVHLGLIAAGLAVIQTSKKQKTLLAIAET
jgi:hypothetical protein